MAVAKAVFFDWFNTLARYDPPREELHRQVFAEFGIELPADQIRRGMAAADRYWFKENAKSPVDKRSPEEQAEVNIGYQRTLLTTAGVSAPRELILKILKKSRELFKSLTFVLFDDVLATMKTLRERRLILGLLTNARKDMISVYSKLGLKPYLDFIVTSEEVGADKPQPPIFLAALERAKVNSSEALYVGDQYELDILGARAVGISPILIDRYDAFPEIKDCPRIGKLTELTEYL